MKADTKRTLVVTSIIIIFFAFHVIVFRGRVDMDISVIKRILFALLAIIVVLPVHELIHWVLMKSFGLKNVKIGIAKDPLGFISLRTTADGRVYGWKNAVILLGPLLILTIIPDAVFSFLNKVPYVLWLAALANSVGCCLDIVALFGKRNL